jgi:hypothetical protein
MITDRLNVRDGSASLNGLIAFPDITAGSALATPRAADDEDSTAKLQRLAAARSAEIRMRRLAERLDHQQ